MTDESPPAAELAEVLRRRRGELGLSQAELAARTGVDARQIRRYESGETTPALQAARILADELDLSLDELAGRVPARRLDLGGEWWASWQTWHRGREVITEHQVRLRQHGEDLDVVAVTRGAGVADGGYLWHGRLHLWDNEALLGWYVANEGAVRSKGTMYFTLHQQGLTMTGRWVGLSFDGPVVTGWSAMARDRTEVGTLMRELLAMPAVPPTELP